ncbi:MAG: hypothetical protein GX682_00015 [Clostridiaceae bacterium]|nr:hypothetical protein [Clostridiaceae bacterium]
MKNCVTIQLKKDEIWVKISEEAEEKEIIECLNKKIKDLKKLYKDDKTPIKVTGKVLKNKEMEEIQNIIKDTINVEVEFESPKILGLHGIKKAFNKEIESSETKFQKGSLRCGQKVEYEGSIVVIGDVNAGAEVIASENIVILGTLRGLAHAGAKGNKNAIIATNMIDCPQIRISNVIKEMEKEEEKAIKCYAYINENDEIVIE